MDITEFERELNQAIARATLILFDLTESARIVRPYTMPGCMETGQIDTWRSKLVNAWVLVPMLGASIDDALRQIFPEWKCNL